MNEKPLVGNCFESVLRQQRRGELLTELSEAIQTATQSVKEFMKPATITLKITIAPADGDGAAVAVIDDVDIKVPKPKRSSSLFYTTDDGRLVRDNPNQTEMQLQVAQSPAQPVAVSVAEASKISQVG